MLTFETGHVVFTKPPASSMQQSKQFGRFCTIAWINRNIWYDDFKTMPHQFTRLHPLYVACNKNLQYSYMYVPSIWQIMFHLLDRHYFACIFVGYKAIKQPLNSQCLVWWSSLLQPYLVNELAQLCSGNCLLIQPQWTASRSLVFS